MLVLSTRSISTSNTNVSISNDRYVNNTISTTTIYDDSASALVQYLNPTAVDSR